jgi:hypothetical protein
MKNHNKLDLNQYCVVEIENTELNMILGSGEDWLASCGAAVGKAWCATKGAWKGFHEAGSCAVSTFRESGGR